MGASFTSMQKWTKRDTFFAATAASCLGEPVGFAYESYLLNGQYFRVPSECVCVTVLSFAAGYGMVQGSLISSF